MSEADNASSLNIWGQRAAGALGAFGAMYGFWSEVSYSLLDGLKGALGGAVLGVILAGLAWLVISIIQMAFTAAAEQNNPLSQGIIFILALFFFFGAADLLLMGGIFIIEPLIDLLYGGDLSGTFWGCEDYITVEEGSYCADGR